jgi:hypothetical protein
MGVTKISISAAIARNGRAIPTKTLNQSAREINNISPRLLSG